MASGPSLGLAAESACELMLERLGQLTGPGIFKLKRTKTPGRSDWASESESLNAAEPESGTRPGGRAACRWTPVAAYYSTIALEVPQSNWPSYAKDANSA